MRTLLLISIVGFVMAGCSGSSNSSSRKPVEANKINGYVGTSNITNAIIYAVPIDEQGQPRLKEGDAGAYAGRVASSDSRAYFEVGVEEDVSHRPVIFIANAKDDDKTQLRCELTTGCQLPSKADHRSAYPLGDEFKLNAAVSSVGDNSRININWITHLAADMAYTSYIDEDGNPSTLPNTSKDCQQENSSFDCPSSKPSEPVEGMFTPYTVERGNIWLSKQFDFNDLDIISLRPIAPSELNESEGLETIRREHGIRYGALLAGGQKLANEAGQTDAEWLTVMVNQQRENQGQLYFNHTSEFSKCSLYTAATDVLDNNIKQSLALNADVKTDANSALEKLKTHKNGFCQEDNKGKLTQIEVSIEEIEKWVNKFEQAKEFVDDLNARILNMRCDDSTGEGFFDCGYVKRTQGYYKELEALYHTHQADLDGALHQMRGDVEAFIACLSGDACASGKFNAKQKTYTINDLTYTLAPVEETLVKKEGQPDKYFAFDFRVTGTIENINEEIDITFNPPKVNKDEPDKEPELDEHNFLRVVYQGDSQGGEAYEVPAKLAFEDVNGNAPKEDDDVEPLGFDFNFPNIELKAQSTQQDFKLYFSAKLIGVTPLLDDEKAMHYNLTEIGLGLNVQGDVLGEIVEENRNTGKHETVELKDTAEFTFNASFNNAADFYAKSLWPSADDYFTTESGVTAENKPDLFEYLLARDEMILISSSTDDDGEITSKVEGEADYFELKVKGIGINRYEIFQNDKKKVLRNCSVSDTGTEREKENSKVCTSAETVPDDFDLIDDLIYSDNKYFENFAIPGYGSYKPEIPEGIKWKGGSIPLEGEWDGELVAEFAQGISKAEMRIAQEFVDEYEEKGEEKVKRAPAAILVVKGNKKTDTSWEIAISMGYNYEYLVDVLPSGKDVESLYLSYFVNEYNDDNDKSYINELGSLSILRQGTELLGKDAIANATIGSNVDYEIDTDENSSASGCGYTNLGAVDKTCSAIAYLSVRGDLVGTLREENGLYVMRYSDGTFSILGI